MQEINSTFKSLPLNIEVYPTTVRYQFAILILGMEIPDLHIDG